ncbi:negative regulator of genetic competence MecA [Halalkalibacter hemicellulosilyticusJCM 9152]|uniref:Negative regulator of genetic competence MecA n=1 Tax=Halalkalibacter hemicellulosilyticusJCM 9152 TaxID=1236971 RepID=W4QGL3_9BACI|nr:negative regulator of genetic competence MecA [Halalkalibacter hemicellulosilyticusJCM 9152]
MMNEASDRDEFELDGPLWIQVHALDKGLEIVVTRGQVTDGNVKLEIPVSQDKDSDEQTVLDLLAEEEQQEDELEQLEIVIGFLDFEDVIALSHGVIVEDLNTELHYFEGTYYVYVLFNDERYNEDQQDDILSQMLEYGYESDVSIYRIKEYGKEIAAPDALLTMRASFDK